ncbi:sensor histidine kinase [Deinococcus lacus]|uniref:Sensor histidine kinase n=1 Tax=Deinococcus lacus TaxID=392561 RepID=A0ABW1YG36_9DEIO
MLLTAGLLQLMRQLWAALAHALLRPDDALEASRRAVRALQRAAGRLALGDDLSVTLSDLLAQTLAGSQAQQVVLLGAQGQLRGHQVQPRQESGGLAGLERQGWEPLPTAALPLLQPVPGGFLAAFPVLVAGRASGQLQAFYAAAPPGPDELSFLMGMADHAGTALHAAELIDRATTRAGEQERARLARELHDSVAQALYGISLGAKTARATLETQPDKAATSLDYTIRLAEGGVSEMKALLFSLRPDALAEGGLVAALGQLAHALEARHGLRVHADLGAEPPLTPQAQAAAYRICQEALHNVVKHARASSVQLSAHTVSAAQEFRVIIRDDGVGFDPAQQAGGTLGQRSMRERAHEAGGALEVLSGPGQGAELRFWVPLLTRSDETDPARRPWEAP